MSCKPIAIFVESNTTGTGADFLTCARKQGLAPVLLTDAPGRYAFLSGLTGIEAHLCDTSSTAAITATIDTLASRAPIALIMSTSDYFVVVAAQQAQRLGLPGPDPAAVALCRDKARQAVALCAAGVGVPSRSVIVSDIAEVARAVAHVGLPAVIKPVSGTGSIGVSLARTETEVIAALQQLFAVTVNARGQAVDSRALLMSYVKGDEFSVEVLDGAIIGVTKKHLGALPHFVEIGHDFPAPISPILRQRVVRIATRAITAVGLARGPAHVELRVTPETEIIIEVNPRLAGGSIPNLIRHAIGVDPVLAVLASARGGRSNLAPAKQAYGSLRFIVPRTDGLFQPSVALHALATQFRLAEATLYHPMPIDFRRGNDFRDRLGHVIAVDADPAAATKRAEDAVALCQA
jgi:biotin carboxylase